MTRKTITFLLAIVVLLTVFGWEWKQSHLQVDLVEYIDVQIDESLAQFLMSQLHVWQAAIAAQEAVSSEPPLDLYLLAAFNAKNLGDLAAAKDFYDRYFLSHKINFVAYDNYGRLLRQMGDLPGAEVAFRRAIELDPGIEAYYHDLARVLMEQGEDEALEQLYKDAITHVGQTRALLVALAQWYEGVGDCERAVTHYEVARQVAENAEMAQAIQEEIDRVEESCR